MKKLLFYLLSKEFVKNTPLSYKTPTPKSTHLKFNLTTKSLLSRVLNKNINLFKLETRLYLMKSVDLKLIKLVLKLLSYLKKPPLNPSDKTLTLLSRIELTLLTLPIWPNSKTCNLVPNFKLELNKPSQFNNKPCNNKLLLNKLSNNRP